MGSEDKKLLALLRLLSKTAAIELDCDQVLDLMGAYLETLEKSAPQAAHFRQHLEVCPECFEEFEALRRALDPPETPAL